MLDLFCVSAALAVGQVPAAPAPPEPPPLPPAAVLSTTLPWSVVPTKAQIPADSPAEAPAISIPALPLSKEKIEDEPSPGVEPPAPVRYFLMREAQGTWLGAFLDDHRLSVSGWFEPSYTQTSNLRFTNQPYVWNDRADLPLLQQAWLRIERSVVTSGTTTPTVGFRVDILSGSDYRFTLPRGLFNAQLLNSAAFDGTPDAFQKNQNLYGVDPIQFYVNTYIPNLFQGTDIRAGRLYTPFGYESVEAVSTPLVSRSYAFNWCPPFTHMGVQASVTFSPRWNAKFMLANGNDVFIDPSQEARFVGAVTYNAPTGKDVITFGTTIGRGQFNAGDPFAPATVGLMSEDVGRNNINVFDIVYIHTFNPVVSYGTELIYGYQSGVPTTAALGVDANPGIVGRVINNDKLNATAHWGSWVQYLNYNFCQELTGITRLELFQDFEGQRTGFEGLYTSITFGLQYKPYNFPGLIIRPEVRYDYNGYSRPFENNHDLFAFAIDALIKF
jgi:hypothetical protein